MFKKGESRFDGGLLGLIGVNLVVFFGSLFTLTIAYPWLLCFKEKWYAGHTFIDGERLTFDGGGGQLIGNWIKWILLSIITLCIYSLWVPLKLEAWKTKHSYFAGSDRNPETSEFKGGLLGFIGINLGSAILTMCTFGIAYPWVVCWKRSWFSKHTVVEGNQLSFNGSGGGLFGNYIKWFLLTIITVGIYGLWVGIKMTKWCASHTEFENVA